MNTTHKGNRIASRRAFTHPLLILIAAAGLLLRWTNSTLSPTTLSTDKTAYYPGQYVTFTGAGWTPGETVTIDVWESTAEPDLYVGSVTNIVAADGTFSNSDFPIVQSFLGQGFIAYATGELPNETATTTFTDANFP